MSKSYFFKSEKQKQNGLFKFYFTQVKRDFHLHIETSPLPLFDNEEILEPSEWLKKALSMASNYSLYSEKARSELLVMPTLLEMAEKMHFSIFSGFNLDVSPEQGLNGECDFILSKKNNKYVLETPIFGLVEAKKRNAARQDIDLAIPQCIAQMIGAKMFNENEQTGIKTIYGCVTTGEEWLFMKLENDVVLIDKEKYFIKDINLILGVLQQIVERN